MGRHEAAPDPGPAARSEGRHRAVPAEQHQAPHAAPPPFHPRAGSAIRLRATPALWGASGALAAAAMALILISGEQGVGYGLVQPPWGSGPSDPGVRDPSAGPAGTPSVSQVGREFSPGDGWLGASWRGAGCDASLLAVVAGLPADGAELCAGWTSGRSASMGDGTARGATGTPKGGAVAAPVVVPPSPSTAAPASSGAGGAPSAGTQQPSGAQSVPQPAATEPGGAPGPVETVAGPVGPVLEPVTRAAAPAVAPVVAPVAEAAAPVAAPVVESLPGPADLPPVESAPGLPVDLPD